jgi:hypothetical protein
MTRALARPARRSGLVVVIAVVAVVLFGTGRAAASPALPPVPTAAAAATVPGPASATTTEPTSDGSAPTGIQVGPAMPRVTTTTSPSVSVPAGSGGGCGLLDVACHVESAIDGWFRDLVTSALAPVLELLGRTVLATPDITGGKVGEVWGVTAGIANALVVLLVLAGGAVVMSHETLQTRYTAKEIAPRVVLAVIAANASLALVGLAVPAANALSQALLGNGVDPATATEAMAQLVVSPLDSSGIFVVLLGLLAAALAVVLLATYVIRVALLALLVAVAPLTLTCHALPQTEGTARLWWRAVAGLFAIQLGQSAVLVCALEVFFTPEGPGALGLPASGGLVDVLVVICMLWVLVRIPAWVSKAVFGAGRSGGLGKAAVKVAVLYRVAQGALAAMA